MLTFPRSCCRSYTGRRTQDSISRATSSSRHSLEVSSSAWTDRSSRREWRLVRSSNRGGRRGKLVGRRPRLGLRAVGVYGRRHSHHDVGTCIQVGPSSHCAAPRCTLSRCRLCTSTRLRQLLSTAGHLGKRKITHLHNGHHAKSNKTETRFLCFGVSPSWAPQGACARSLDRSSFLATVRRLGRFDESASSRPYQSEDLTRNKDVIHPGNRKPSNYRSD